jgi:hypothetical protein
VVLNRIAHTVVDARRGQHVRNVFAFRGAPVKHMLNSAWKNARIRAGLDQVRVQHTFGRHLRAAGVSFEDRQDLLGHRRITTHCSAVELSRLIEAAEKVCERDGRWPEMVVLRGALTPAKVPQRGLVLERVYCKFLISLAGGQGFEAWLAESEFCGVGCPNRDITRKTLRKINACGSSNDDSSAGTNANVATTATLWQFAATHELP